MSLHEPCILHVDTLQDARREIKKIGSDPQSVEIMAPKAVSKVIKFKNVVFQDAIIIKQDMLSIGGEVAVPQKTFKLYDQTGDILIIGTLKQLIELVSKLERHYQRLRNIAKELALLLKDMK